MSDDRLSQIQTLWSVVRRAHGDETGDAQSAQQQMLDRYGGAIRRYLLGAVRNEELADELFQEFSLHFLRGDYERADPERGRFRSFLKTVLFRLVANHFRQTKRRTAAALGDGVREPAVDDTQDNEQFAVAWRDELLGKAWLALAEEQKRTGKPLFTVMRAKLESPSQSSPELAERISQQLGRPISSANLRVMLHRARDRFAELLFDEVSQTLDNPSRNDLEEELAELRLLEYCRPALQRRTPSE
jgi:RNA polymerase sigma-70 factor (ECF subfamily)